MSTIGKVISVLFVSAILTGCGGPGRLDVYTQNQQRTSLGLTQKEPLKLNGINWKVDKKGPSYCTDTSGYTSLAINMEKLQDRLNYDEKVIKEMKKYYEKGPKSHD